MHSSEKRKLAAILFADIADYTALMQENEQNALSLLRKFKQEPETQVQRSHRRIVQFYGDGCLVIR